MSRKSLEKAKSGDKITENRQFLKITKNLPLGKIFQRVKTIISSINREFPLIGLLRLIVLALQVLLLLALHVSIYLTL